MDLNNNAIKFTHHQMIFDYNRKLSERSPHCAKWTRTFGRCCGKRWNGKSCNIAALIGIYFFLLWNHALYIVDVNCFNGISAVVAIFIDWHSLRFVCLVSAIFTLVGVFVRFFVVVVVARYASASIFTWWCLYECSSALNDSTPDLIAMMHETESWFLKGL